MKKINQKITARDWIIEENGEFEHPITLATDFVSFLESFNLRTQDQNGDFIPLDGRNDFYFDWFNENSQMNDGFKILGMSKIQIPIMLVGEKCLALRCERGSNKKIYWDDLLHSAHRDHFAPNESHLYTAVLNEVWNSIKLSLCHLHPRGIF
jgi:hypothetical protein